MTSIVEVKEAEDSTNKDRAIRLFRFLKEVVNLRTRIVRSLDAYEQVQWFSDIPKEQECECIAWNPERDEDADEVWLTVRKPRLVPPPEVPKELEPWVERHEIRDSEKEPSIAPRILIEPEEEDEQEDEEPEAEGEWVEDADEELEASGPRFEELSDHPEIQQAWQVYLNQWRKWAEVDRRKQSVRKVYTYLFTLHQQQKELGESYEVVLGLGHLKWQVESGQVVNRHLIVAQTNVEFDADKGIIQVGPAIDGAHPRLEQDMLEPDERPGGDILNSIENMLKGIEGGIWQEESIKAALRTWTNSSATGRGLYDDELPPCPQAGQEPHVRWAPALILRKRTERGYLDFYSKILADLDERDDIPEGVGPLVNIDWEEAQGSEYPPGEVPIWVRELPDSDIYFPLPANDEQRAIVGRLTHTRGVLVQGPPGTGKSHTIANLVSHLLATGQRVLVTSETERALRVLHDRIPPSINELCVVLLGYGNQAFEELEHSVKGITHKHNDWNPRREAEREEGLADELDRLRARSAQIRNELKGIREADTHRHPPMFGGYLGTVQQIAIRLREEEQRYHWIVEYLDSGWDGGDEPPLTNNEAIELLTRFREVTPEEERDNRRRLPELGDLATPDEFDEMVAAESQAGEDWEAATHASGTPATEFRFESDQDLLTRFAWALDGLVKKHYELMAFPHSFAKNLANDTLTGAFDGWGVLRSQTRERIESIEQHDEGVLYLSVTGIDGIDYQMVRQHALELHRHVEMGGRLTKRFFRYQKTVRERAYLVEGTQVGGRPVDTAQALRLLADWAEVRFQLDRLRGLWIGTADLPEGDLIRQLGHIRTLCKAFSLAEDLGTCLENVTDLAERITGFTPPPWHDQAALQSLQRTIRAELLRRRVAQQKDRLDALDQALRSLLVTLDRHGLADQLQKAIADRQCLEYRGFYQQIERAWERRAHLSRRDELLRRVRIDCRLLADAISAQPDRHEFDQWLQDFSSAWNWARADRWLRVQLDPNRYQRLISELDSMEQAIQRKTEELAASKAWQACMSRMRPRQETMLKAWMQTISLIGAGTGKRVERYRRLARQQMEGCRSAIPAWIMPLYRVVESVTPGEDLFDVVIIDEASQSGIEALFLFYIAKKIIVVGDDKQIAPSNIGIERGAVDILQRQYLSDIPLPECYDLDLSFFDQAFIRYRDRLRLREHFRCMPEIIQFSNNLCYENEPLIPLRQYGADRIEPVVKTVYVADGFLKGSGTGRINPPEVDAIVDAIERCCKDQRYKGMSMGVISLLGDRQAREIEARLLSRLGPEEIERRRIVCGDAYAFQGDERDIIFMSLVTTPENTRPLSKNADSNVRRFNVAASRAKDQLWLFHSVTVDDLRPNCLRRMLLEYCLNPTIEQETISGNSIQELKRQAKNRGEGSTPPEPFESWFEVDVFIRIRERGFRVVPQYRVGEYRIDLVVSGMKERIAVECDGEAWHGPDRYEHDQARQRQLERCGWRFYRIRGGAFYRSQDEALEPLWGFLEELGVHPNSTENAKSAPPVETPSVARGRQELNGQQSRRGNQDELEVTDDEEHHGTRIDGDSTNNGNAPQPIELRSTSTAQDGLFSSSDSAESLPDFPDPRTGKLRAIREGLVYIVERSGPMPCHYAYRLYADHAGIQRISKAMRTVLDRAMVSAVQAGQLHQRDEFNIKGQHFKIVRGIHTQPVVIRLRGDRPLDAIPPSEVAAVMARLISEGRVEGASDEESLYRAVLEYYGLVRLTTKTQEMLSIAKQLLSTKAHCPSE